MCLYFRIKEEPSEIHFPELDEIDEVNDAEQLLNLESKSGLNSSKTYDIAFMMFRANR